LFSGSKPEPGQFKRKWIRRPGIVSRLDGSYDAGPIAAFRSATHEELVGGGSDSAAEAAAVPESIGSAPSQSVVRRSQTLAAENE